MPLLDAVKDALDKFKEVKLGMCQRFKGPIDLIPMLHLKYQHLANFCGMMVDAPGDPIDALPKMWARTFDHGFPEILMFVTEGYIKIARKEDANTYARGQFEEDFKTNPGSDVREAITVHAVEMKTGEQVSGVVAYKYDDAGLPVFDPATTIICSCSGEALMTRMSKVFTRCHELSRQYIESAKEE